MATQRTITTEIEVDGIPAPVTAQYEYHPIGDRIVIGDITFGGDDVRHLIDYLGMSTLLGRIRKEVRNMDFEDMKREVHLAFSKEAEQSPTTIIVKPQSVSHL